MYTNGKKIFDERFKPVEFLDLQLWYGRNLNAIKYEHADAKIRNFNIYEISDAPATPGKETTH